MTHREQPRKPDDSAGAGYGVPVAKPAQMARLR